ncbi:MAG: type IV pilus modification PilV family protein [Candidatus Altimarinota bacterium]
MLAKQRAKTGEMMVEKNTSESSAGFTLVEVIVSIAVLVFVITSATGILTSVMRSNSDNLSALLAYGLAQEGVEAVRNIRDSNFVLGLDFDGKKPGSFDVSVWGANLFEADSETPKLFILNKQTQIVDSCTTSNLVECMPFQLTEVGVGEITEELKSSDNTKVFRINEEEQNPEEMNLFVQEGDLTSTETQFHRIIRIEPIKSKGLEVDTLRVSSMVFWPSASSDLERRVVVTTDLTNWKE